MTDPGLILVDQDGVLADFERSLLETFRTRHPDAPFVPLADRRGFYAREQYPPRWRDAVTEIVHEPGFYASLLPVPGALTAMGELTAADYDVFICTSPLVSSHTCTTEKLAWVEQHLGRPWLRRMIITSDKTLVGDATRPCVLIDDRPHVSGAAGRPPWTQVLFDAPYNRDAGPARFRLRRWADWRAVVEPALAASHPPVADGQLPQPG